MPKGDGLTYEQRFWTKVNKRGPWAVVRGRRSRCWEWIGGLNGSGYGYFWINGKGVGAHAVAYLLQYGPIPQGKELDHLCRNRRCIRHTEAVTARENILRGAGAAANNARKSQCRCGRQFDRVGSKGERRCSTCLQAHSALFYARNRRRLSAQSTARQKAKRTHCPQGHPYSGSNLLTYANGNRRCATCEPVRIARLQAARWGRT